MFNRVFVSSSLLEHSTMMAIDLYDVIRDLLEVTFLQIGNDVETGPSIAGT